jgi:hypothetical protein
MAWGVIRHRWCTEWRLAILYILRADFAGLVEELDCHNVSVAAPEAIQDDLLRGGKETHGCVSLKDSEMDDLRKRLPLS